jgi:hypothetical protein
MHHEMRGPKKAAEDDRRTAWHIPRSSLSSQETDEAVVAWVEDGRDPPGRDETYHLAVKIAAALEAERQRSALEIALVLGRAEGLNKGGHVRIQDPRSHHYGKSAIIWFIRDGRVMVTMADPQSIGGSSRDSFLPEHLEKLEDPAPLNLERAVLLRFMRESADMHDNLTSTQARCTKLLLAARSMRKRIAELGGEDPGDP